MREFHAGTFAGPVVIDLARILWNVHSSGATHVGIIPAALVSAALDYIAPGPDCVDVFLVFRSALDESICTLCAAPLFMGP